MFRVFYTPIIRSTIPNYDQQDPTLQSLFISVNCVTFYLVGHNLEYIYDARNTERQNLSLDIGTYTRTHGVIA